LKTGASCLLLADIVAKVFLGGRTKILRAADAITRGDVRDHIVFIQNRSRISVVALKSDAAQRSPTINFREIFWVVRFSTFCNNIGTEMPYQQ